MKNLLTVFNKYKVGECGYSPEKAIKDARLIAHSFTPAKNDARARYQLAKLAGIANSIDFIVSARLYLHADNVCKDESLVTLMCLHNKIALKAINLYYKTPSLSPDDATLQRLIDLCSIR